MANPFWEKQLVSYLIPTARKEMVMKASAESEYWICAPDNICSCRLKHDSWFF